MMEMMVWAAICALIGLGCFGGIAWTLLSGEDTGVERIFLVHVWLILGLLFLGLAAWIAKQGPLKRVAKAAPESAAAPAAQKVTKSAS